MIISVPLFDDKETLMEHLKDSINGEPRIVLDDLRYSTEGFWYGQLYFICDADALNIVSISTNVMSGKYDIELTAINKWDLAKLKEVL